MGRRVVVRRVRSAEVALIPRERRGRVEELVKSKGLDDMRGLTSLSLSTMRMLV